MQNLGKIYNYPISELLVPIVSEEGLGGVTIRTFVLALVGFMFLCVYIS